MSQPVDIRPDHLQIVQDILNAHIPNHTVWVFGSRAKWTTKDSSDLDLCVKGKEPLSFATLAHLRDDFSESDLPYKVDIVDWYGISENFRKIIDQDKVVFPQKKRSEWREMSLGDALEINPPVKMPKGVQLPYIEMQSIEVGNKNVSASQYRIFSGGGARFEDGDTLMARITPCLENGKIARYKAHEKNIPAHGSTEFIILRNKEGVTHDRFVYYLTISDFVKQRAIAQMTGSSGRQRVPTDSLKRIMLSFPSIKEQEAITDILEILDDKIELNRQMNETLEEIARALFKSWFVDFDPVHAKMAGCQPEGLSADLAVLFPNSFIGGKPKGWSEESVYSYAEYINGTAYKNMYFSNDEDALPVVKIVELKNGIEQGTKLTNTNLGNKYQLNTGDILFSWSGSPETSIDTFLWVGGSVWLNQHIFRVVTKTSEMRTFVFFLLKHLKPVFIATAKDKQTTGLGHVTIQDLKRIKTTYPSFEVLKAFSEIATPILDSMQRNLTQIAILSNLRDYLLPKLISGTLRVENSA